MLRSKIHRATLTGTELDYEGSIAIDRNLIEAAGLLPGEQVHVLNLSNAQRLITYVIEAPAGSGTMMLNGPAARLGAVGDKVTILAYAVVDARKPASSSRRSSTSTRKTGRRSGSALRATLLIMEPMFQQLGISLLLGLLVGLQREHVAGGFAGMRTFPLITVFGTLSAMLATQMGAAWIVAVGMLGVVAVAVVGHLIQPRGNDGEKGTGPICAAHPKSHSGKSDQSPFPSADSHRGVTTDVAMLLMFAVGAFLAVGAMSVAVAVGGGVAVLLQFKPELHQIAQKLGDEDLRAIMQFVLITCIILPVLPNQKYGPDSFFHLRQPLPGLDVLNPREIWLMVVLIVGLSLGGYISYKYFGRNAGILLGGILGGAVSSTATTVSYARGTRDDPIRMRTAAIVIMIASTIMYARVVLAVAIVSSWEFLQTILLPVAVLTFLTMLPAMVLWYRVRGEPSQMPKQENPTQLKSAIVFAVMYAAVLMALAAAQSFWHGHGMYAVAFLSGLTEMDAVTLSTARLSVSDPLVAADGWRIIVVAATANLVSKAAIAGLLGGRRLLARIAVLFAIPAAGGIAMLLLM